MAFSFIYIINKKTKWHLVSLILLLSLTKWHLVSFSLLLTLTKWHLVSFSLLLNQTKWHLVLSSPNKTKPNSMKILSFVAKLN